MSRLSVASFWRSALADYCARSKEFILAASFAVAALIAWAAGMLVPDLARSLDPGLAILVTLVAPFVVCAVALSIWAWRRRRRRKAAGLFGVVNLSGMGRIARDFPRGERLAAAVLLETCTCPERARVVDAIVRLSKGNLERLRHFCEVAALDYRDVLMWAAESRE